MNIAKLNTVSLDDKVIIKRGNGGSATINNQSKVVDITENGSVDIVPDAGYTGLAKVTANVNVSGGGGELEGEYYLARPNGWYWKITDELNNASDDDYMPTIIGFSLLYGKVYDTIRDLGLGIVTQNDHILTYRNIGMLQARQQSKLEVDRSLIAFREACPVTIDTGEVYIEANSVFELMNLTMGTMTEVEFEAMALAEFGLQRITKEEYESLIIA